MFHRDNGGGVSGPTVRKESYEVVLLVQVRDGVYLNWDSDDLEGIEEPDVRGTLGVTRRNRLNTGL